MRNLLIILLLVAGSFANSPQGLKELSKEHKEVLPTHDIQLKTVINKLELDKYISLNSSILVTNLSDTT